MKKILVILLLQMAIAFNVFAQGEGDRIVNPTWKLSSGALSPTVSTWTLTLPATTFSPSIITPLIIGGADTISTLTYKTTTGVGKTGARHIFQVGNNGATEAMTILNSGYVGVGTIAPLAKLHVEGNFNLHGIQYQYNLGDAIAANYEYVRHGFLGNIFYIQSLAGGTGTQRDISLYNGMHSLYIKNNSNIGIGTATPYAQLSQVGATPIWYATDSDVNKSRTNLATATDTAAIKIDASAAQPTISVKNTTGNGFALSSVAAGGASFDGIVQVGNGTVALPAYSFISDPNTGIYRKGADTLGISTNGTNVITVAGSNVGIGTTAPKHLLESKGSSFTIATDSTYPMYAQTGGYGVALGGSSTYGGVISGVQSGIAWKNLLLNPNGGFVGIGTATPTNLFNVNGAYNYFTDSSSVNDSWGFATTAITAMTAGMQIFVNISVANTDGATLQINALGAKAVLKRHDTALITGDVEVGQIIHLIYDGTNWQMLSQLAQ